MSKSSEMGASDNNYDDSDVHVHPYGEEEILNEVNLIVKPYLRYIGTNY